MAPQLHHSNTKQSSPQLFTANKSHISSVTRVLPLPVSNSIIMDSVTRMVADKSVVIFTKSSCCMSHSIQTLITSFGANPTVYELDAIPNGQKIEKALLQLGCRPSVPAVFIGQQFIGGAKEVMSLQVRNELPQLLMRAGAIWL